MKLIINMINDKTGEVIELKNERVTRAMEAVGLLAEGYAKSYAPVDTGRLRNSITHETEEETTYIGTNVEYAVYQEFGTKNMSAQPFLRPAIENHIDEYKQVAESILKE